MDGPGLLEALVTALGVTLVMQIMVLVAVGGCVRYETCTYPALPKPKAATVNLK